MSDPVLLTVYNRRCVDVADIPVHEAEKFAATLATSVAAGGPNASDLIRILPFGKPVPSRRVALAWRKSFPRPEAIEVLRKSILACNLPQVEKLT